MLTEGGRTGRESGQYKLWLLLIGLLFVKNWPLWFSVRLDNGCLFHRQDLVMYNVNKMLSIF